MRLSNNYILVDRVTQEKKEGFQAVEVQDDFVFKGKVILTPEQPVWIGNDTLRTNDVVLFAKYSPDTHEIDYDGRKVKLIHSRDILGVL